MVSSKKEKMMRRFSDEQIRRLEVMFESDTKLEPKKKDDVARELGLQPRQVSIWFQNRRARWKSKQLEKDYNLLLSNYNNLSSQFDAIKKHNQSLLSQLEKLKSEKVAGVNSEDREKNNCRVNQETGDGNNSSNSTSSGSSSDGESDDHYRKMEYDDHQLLKYTIPDDSTTTNEEEALNFLQGLEEEVNDDHLFTTSSAEAHWGTSTLDSDDLIYPPTTHNTTESYQWLDFWC